MSVNLLSQLKMAGDKSESGVAACPDVWITPKTQTSVDSELFSHFRLSFSTE